VTVIGDSVTIDASPDLKALIHGCVVDAQVGMQWQTGIGVLSSLRSGGSLGAEVVVALGNNGPVSATEFAQMMAVLNGVSRVVIVNNHVPDSWGASNDALFSSEVSQYPRARLANWNALGDAHPGWFYSDRTHMPIGGPGARAFAELVRSTL
jgi:hypothetical protein